MQVEVSTNVMSLQVYNECALPPSSLPPSLPPLFPPLSLSPPVLLSLSPAADEFIERGCQFLSSFHPDLCLQVEGHAGTYTSHKHVYAHCIVPNLLPFSVLWFVLTTICGSGREVKNREGLLLFVTEITSGSHRGLEPNH